MVQPVFHNQGLVAMELSLELTQLRLALLEQRLRALLMVNPLLTAQQLRVTQHQVFPMDKLAQQNQ